MLAASASAQAGITIPAGEWTLDISGNVNSFYNYTNHDTNKTAISGGLATSRAAGAEDKGSTITTGLLPNFLSVAGKTRQNDLDVAFLISLNPGGGSPSALSGGSGAENRQAFITVGDASWGSFKFGKDLGVFGSDAILSDMTLLGVGGAPHNAGGKFQSGGGTTTLGGIGAGYIYADWMPQFAYTTPNWNGFQATVALMQAWDPNGTAGGYFEPGFNATQDGTTAVTGSRKTPAVEAKASYSWTGDVAGKVWVETMYQKHDDLRSTISGFQNGQDISTHAYGVGANVNVAGFGLTGYYYDADGVGTTLKYGGGLSLDSAGKLHKRDSDGGYIQASYVIPTGTKLGVAYAKSNLDEASGETYNNLVKTNRRWTVGAYHPLTKSLNLVAEYTDMKSERQHGGQDISSDAITLGAILFY